MISVENWNKTYSKYPITVEDKGWIYGVWYCGTAYQKVTLYGQYPRGFVERALALFPGIPHDRILHCPSGTIKGPGMTVDLHVDEVRCPKVQAPADALPFPDNSYSLVLSDPPYSAADSKKYGCKPFPMRGFMREAKRVLEPGGYLCVLDTKYPSFKRGEWDLLGLIAVVTGVQRATRMFSIFRNIKAAAPDAREGR